MPYPQGTEEYSWNWPGSSLLSLTVSGGAITTATELWSTVLTMSWILCGTVSTGWKG